MIALVGAVDQADPVAAAVVGGPLNQEANVDIAPVVIPMHHSPLLYMISWAATITTIGVGLTGLNICMKIRRMGTVGDISPAPFVAGVANALLWIRYGMIINDSTILIVNWTNGILQTSYVACFYYYAVSKVTLYKYLFVGGVIVLPCYVYSLKVGLNTSLDDVQGVKNLIGTVASFAAISFCAAPLAQMRVVIQTRSTETMSFLMALATFLMSVEWFVYGYLIADKFVEVPNFIGAILGATQLFLFYKYPTPSGGSGKLSAPLPL